MSLKKKFRTVDSTSLYINLSTLLFLGEATGTNESLKQSQRLLQQAKADNAEALGKITALEKELTAFRDTKEEVHAIFLPVEG